MGKEDLLNRINSLNASRIRMISPEVMPTLTDNFDESLVRALLLRGQSNTEQRKILDVLKQSYYIWIRKRNLFMRCTTISVRMFQR